MKQTSGSLCSWEETRRRLQGASLEPFDDTPIPQRQRFFCRDPVGNLIELSRIEGDYLKLTLKTSLGIWAWAA